MLFILLGYQVTERVGRGRQGFHALAHSPNGRHSQSWSIPKPRASSFFQVSPVVGGTQGRGPSFTALPGHWQEAGSEAELPGLSPVLDAGTTGEGVT